MATSNQGELLIIDKRHEALEPAAPQSTDLLTMIQVAVTRGADLAMIEKLMDLKERHEANEARKAFEEAMAAFKSENIFIRKDKVNPQYNSTYVSLGNLIATVTPFLSKHGLSASWDVDQSAGIRVTCFVTHKQGHSRSCSMTVPPDKSGAKNPIQEIKSAITYAKACTFESVCGLASSDANVNDDGNGTGRQRMEDIAERLEWIANARNVDELEKLFKESYKVASAAKDTKAQQALIKAKDERKAELR